MAERVFINDLNPITDIQDGAKILVDQNGYKKMFYEDFVIDIAGTLKSEHGTGWNADLIAGIDVSVEVPQQGEVLIYSSASNEFENRRIDSNDIDWSSISVNEYKFLQVGSGGIVEQDFVSIPSLRIDNDTSGGYFLRVKSGNRQIEAVPFDPSEFTINAQTLEGNTVSDLDGRYLRVSNNLQDITNASTARNSLNVISESESDSRYLSRTGNLSDVNNAATSFNNIKQNSSTSYAGVIEIATSPEVQDGIRGDVAVVPSTLSDNYYNKATSDARFLNSANNLDDLNNSTAARQNLNVYSSSETDSRYLQKTLNLSDIGSRQLARDNLEVYDRNYIDTFTLNPINNLSDVDNISQARNNLNVYDRSDVYTKSESDGRYNHPIYLGTDDLDLIQGAGTYYQTSNANTSAARGYPVNLAGSLFVQKAAGVTQQYQTYGQDRRFFIRGYYSGVWSAWKEIGDSSGGFQQSLGQEGYQILPSGLIFQWGRIYTATDGASTVNLPYTFPNAMIQAQATLTRNSAANLGVSTYSYSTNSFVVRNSDYAQDVEWFAIGY